MPDDMSMRAVQMPIPQDTELRQLAFENGVSVNDLIRSALISKMAEWRMPGNEDVFVRDLEQGRSVLRG